ncbi:predicted protein [Arabidopsis lyrata subsp. lyrata]|uniref:Predicted protein n=1 Tax=Arabidopsis lyrata subsp. lyrata TaxID=81972 RepID=D7L7S4_ARALL|nr:predicted protein [Arabidopsis lyrata subsp. lyrata]
MAIKQGDESTLISWVPDESTILAKMKLYLQNPSTRTILFKTINCWNNQVSLPPPPNDPVASRIASDGCKESIDNTRRRNEPLSDLS